jgi:hypothetical protein
MFALKLVICLGKKGEVRKGKSGGVAREIKVPPIYGFITVNRILDDLTTQVVGTDMVGANETTEELIPEYTTYFKNISLDKIFTLLRTKFSERPIFTNADIVVTVDYDNHMFEDIIPRPIYINTNDETIIRVYQDKIMENISNLNSNMKDYTKLII